MKISDLLWRAANECLRADDHEKYWHGVNKGHHTEWVTVNKVLCARVTNPGTNKGWWKNDVMCVEYVKDAQGYDIPGTLHIVRAISGTTLYYSANQALGNQL